MKVLKMLSGEIVRLKKKNGLAENPCQLKMDDVDHSAVLKFADICSFTCPTPRDNWLSLPQGIVGREAAPFFM